MPCDACNYVIPAHSSGRRGHGLTVESEEEEEEILFSRIRRVSQAMGGLDWMGEIRVEPRMQRCSQTIEARVAGESSDPGIVRGGGGGRLQDQTRDFLKVDSSQRCLFLSSTLRKECVGQDKRIQGELKSDLFVNPAESRNLNLNLAGQISKLPSFSPSISFPPSPPSHFTSTIPYCLPISPSSISSRPLAACQTQPSATRPRSHWPARLFFIQNIRVFLFADLLHTFIHTLFLKSALF